MDALIVVPVGNEADTVGEVVTGARGWRVHEVPVAALPRERQRSRFRPISDGVAIGGYIAGRVFVRWALEAGALIGALVHPHLGERRRARHAATLEQTAGYAGSFPLWAMAVGGAAFQNVVNRVRLWRRDPRPRRAFVAAQGRVAHPESPGYSALPTLARRT